MCIRDSANPLNDTIKSINTVTIINDTIDTLLLLITVYVEFIKFILYNIIVNSMYCGKYINISIPISIYFSEILLKMCIRDSCGSDSHGGEDDIKHGSLGSMKMDEEWLTKFLTKLKA